MDPKELKFKGMDWIQVVECRVSLWSLVKKVMKFGVPKNTENIWAADQLFSPQK
jgi:hypothetical protein